MGFGYGGVKDALGHILRRRSKHLQTCHIASYHKVAEGPQQQQSEDDDGDDNVDKLVIAFKDIAFGTDDGEFPVSMGYLVVKHHIAVIIDSLVFLGIYLTRRDLMTATVGKDEVAFRIGPFFGEFLCELAQRDVRRDNTDVASIGRHKGFAIRDDLSAVVACDIVAVGEGIDPKGLATQHGETVPVHAEIEIALVALLLRLDLSLIATRRIGGEEPALTLEEIRLKGDAAAVEYGVQFHYVARNLQQGIGLEVFEYLPLGILRGHLYLAKQHRHALGDIIEHLCSL